MQESQVLTWHACCQVGKAHIWEQANAALWHGKHSVLRHYSDVPMRRLHPKSHPHAMTQAAPNMRRLHSALRPASGMVWQNKAVVRRNHPVMLSRAGNAADLI